MKKKTKYTIILVTLILFLLGIILSFTNIFTISYQDDFLIFDEFSSEIEWKEFTFDSCNKKLTGFISLDGKYKVINGADDCIAPSKPFIRDGKLVLTGNTKLIINKDFRENDIIVTGNSILKYEIKFQANVVKRGIFPCGYSEELGYNLNNFNIKIESSSINPDKYVCYGIGTVTEKYLNNNPLILEFSSINDRGVFVTDTEIDFIRYRLPFNCNANLGEGLGSEIFKGGSKITLHSFRYSPPIKLCNFAIRTSEIERGVNVDFEVMHSLTNPPYEYIIPQDEMLKLFYVFNLEGTDIIIPCEKGSYYTVDGNKSLGCKDIFAFTEFCNGIWDDIGHSCTTITQSDVRYNCSGTLDISKSPPQCIVYLPSTIICEDINAKPDYVNNVCYKIGEEVCEVGYIRHPIRNRCEKLGIISNVYCKAGDSIGIVSGLCEDVNGNNYEPYTTQQEACEKGNGKWINNKCEMEIKTEIKEIIVNAVEQRAIQQNLQTVQTQPTIQVEKQVPLFVYILIGGLIIVIIFLIIKMSSKR